jgi:hypothetical protein
MVSCSKNYFAYLTKHYTSIIAAIILAKLFDLIFYNYSGHPSKNDSFYSTQYEIDITILPAEIIHFTVVQLKKKINCQSVVMLV